MTRQRFFMAAAIVAVAFLPIRSFATSGTHATVEDLQAAIEGAIETVLERQPASEPVDIEAVVEAVLASRPVPKEPKPAESPPEGEPESAAVRTFAAGFGTANSQCGTGIGNAFIEYDDDSDTLPMHLYIRTGPNGSCSGQGTAVDAQVSKRWAVGDESPWYASLTGGFDRRVVPFEFETRDPGKLFDGVPVDTVSAMVGLGFDGGDWSLGLRFDGIEQDYEGGGGVSPFSLAYTHHIGPAEIDATWTGLGDSRPIIDAGVTVARGHLQASLRGSLNAGLLDNPAPAQLVADDGTILARMGNPDFVYSVDVGWRF